MSTDDYDRAAVELVTGLLPGWGDEPEDPQLLAERVLDHLADAGLLLPPNGARYREWRVAGAPDHRFFTEEHARKVAATKAGQDKAIRVRSVTEWPDGSMRATGWTEVPQ